MIGPWLDRSVVGEVIPLVTRTDLGGAAGTFLVWRGVDGDLGTVDIDDRVGCGGDYR